MSRILKMKNHIAIILLLFTACFCFADEPLIEQVIELKNECEVDTDFIVEVENLVGILTVELSSENKIECITKSHAFAKDEKKAKDLAGKLQMKVEGDRKKVSISAQYPLSEHSIYYYPASEKELKKRGSAKSKSKFYKNKLHYRGENVTVMSEPSLASIYLFADISLKIPASGKVILKNYVGTIRSQGIVGDLTVESSTGTIRIAKGQGKLQFSTASGNIDIKGQQGDMSGFAGLGNIELSSCQGSVEINTGSANVTCKDSQFSNLQIKSGSGTVSLDKTSGDLIVSCGSGRVQADDFDAKKILKIETGSGSVRLKGDLSSVEQLFIQTGSGTVTLVSTPFPELPFDVKSGSGDLEIKVPGIKLESTGEQKAIIRTGSGDIRLETSRKKQSSKSKKEASSKAELE